MPYALSDDGKCVNQVDGEDKVVSQMHCYDNHEEALAYMRALYASVEDAHKADNDPHVGGGVDRDRIPGEDFAGKDRSYPIVTPEDVSDAAHSIGRAGASNDDASTLRANITRIAKRKGPTFEAALPDEWKKSAADEAAFEAMIAFGVKAIFDAGKSSYVWAGVSHNAWQDRQQDTIPLRLIEEDIAAQKNMIQKGEWPEFGLGLWLDHKSDQVLGDCQMREVIKGGRSCFEMGNLKPEYAGLSGVQMSVGYWSVNNKSGEYEWIFVYERSALQKTKAINARTFFSVKRRDLTLDSALKAIAEELIAASNGG